MKSKIIISFLILCILTLFFTYSLNRVCNLEKIDTENRSNLVNINDLIKNAKSFLENAESFLKNGDNSKLSYSLKESGYDLELYDLSGKVIFDSRNKKKLGEQCDINNLLSVTNIEKTIFTISYKDKDEQKFALALIDSHEQKFDFDKFRDRIIEFVWILWAVIITIVILIFMSVYFYILRPFKKLEHFASEVAKGNLDIPLVLQRQNIFGAFTWAFDMLRTELKTSKTRELEANTAKKELVAVLSHDIRTPIASIKAYSECLQTLPDKNSERSQRYINVIIEKTDEITKLSQDMFLHAISDLEKLEITPGEYSSRDLLNNIIEPLILHYENRIVITAPIPDVNIFTDKFRLAQVFENIISNSAKYAADSAIEIEAFVEEDMLKCRFRDYGEGVLPEEIPFIFDKFYRGKNAKDSGETGSGIGLYISKYILEKTGGQTRALNYYEDKEKGFLIEIALKIR